MQFRQSVLSAIVMVSLIALSSLVAVKASFDIPEFPNALMFENGNSSAFYEPADKLVASQNKILVNAFDKIITREPIITYLEKQEKSPPAIPSIVGMPYF